MVTLMEGLREAEENILECLGSGHRLLYNLAATKKLASIQKQHEEIVEGLVFALSMSFFTPKWRKISYKAFEIQSEKIIVVVWNKARCTLLFKLTWKLIQ